MYRLREVVLYTECFNFYLTYLYVYITNTHAHTRTLRSAPGAVPRAPCRPRARCGRRPQTFSACGNLFPLFPTVAGWAHLPKPACGRWIWKVPLLVNPQRVVARPRSRWRLFNKRNIMHAPRFLFPSGYTYTCTAGAQWWRAHRS